MFIFYYQLFYSIHACRTCIVTSANLIVEYLPSLMMFCLTIKKTSAIKPWIIAGEERAICNLKLSWFTFTKLLFSFLGWFQWPSILISHWLVSTVVRSIPPAGAGVSGRMTSSGTDCVRAGAVGTTRATDHCWLGRSIVAWHVLIGPWWTVST
jgi:hypothetical protein